MPEMLYETVSPGPALGLSTQIRDRTGRSGG